jgi:hypothetical protein
MVMVDALACTSLAYCSHGDEKSKELVRDEREENTVPTQRTKHKKQHHNISYF